MSPLDDELRRTLATRAASVPPPADPLAGIESRARGLRRRRALGVVASAAVAVAAVALVVPAVIPDRGTTAPPQLASPSTVQTHPAVLDPAQPWDYRGDPALLTDGTVEAAGAAWSARHAGSTLTPLFGQVWEPSGRPELAFVASGDGTLRVGWVIMRAGGPEFVQEETALPDAAYQFALPGDEGVTRLYVIAAPDSRVDLALDGTAYEPMLPLHPGMGLTAGDLSTARVRVTASDDSVVYEAEARQQAASGSPANVLSWPARGDSSVGPSVEDLKAAYARENPAESGTVRYRPLFAGDTESGVRFAVGQVWRAGDDRAETVSYAVGVEGGPVLQMYGATPDGAAAVVALLTSLPGTSVDLLVVIPTPTTGQVSYAAGATGAFRPVTGQDHLDGVVLIDRTRGATEDRLEVLDGNGDLDNPLYRGPLAPFLELMR